MKGIEYIKNTPQVRDVLLSGGDPLMLPDDYLDWILAEISQIPHVEVLRIGSRMPVVMPYRITDDLIKIFKKYDNLWLNTQFNHPNEITTSSRNALKKLAEAGIPLGNQSVLLRGVNDCPRIMKSLVHKLVANRVRPYYLYQCDLSEGLEHFRTDVGTKVLAIAQSKAKSKTYVPLDLPAGMQLRVLSTLDAPAMAEVYKLVFKTYPFPIHDPTYLIQTMEENVIYFGVFLEKNLIALASCETDFAYLNSEMTDFAILPSYRGQNLSLILLQRTEEEIRSRGYKTLYTIARAVSFGMNATFAKADYIFGGTLINNTNISGKIENMNVWYKAEL